MQRSHTSSNPVLRWDSTQSHSGKWNAVHPQHNIPFSAQNSPSSHRARLEQLGFKYTPFSRHASEEELHKISLQTKPVPLGDLTFRREQPLLKRNSGKIQDFREKSKQISRNLRSKPVLLQPTNHSDCNFKGIPLKQTASTNWTDHHPVPKHQKNFPSFIRGRQLAARWKADSSLNHSFTKDSFVIMKMLGEGKFGTVFLAREKTSGWIVALKAILKRKIIAEGMLTQFVRELKIQAFLEHRSIMRNYGFFQDNDIFYSIQELGCDGPLYSLIANGNTLEEESTSFIVSSLLEGVSLMHKHKILHRDIKPQNIVLVHGNVKLCDFGWAVHKKQQLRGTFCGTPLYLSPQILQGGGYDEKVDLWSVGILAFELCFGCSPFQIKETSDLPRILTEDVRFPSDKPSSPEFQQFIRVILRKNPNERLQASKLLEMEFIKKYRQLQTCQELCGRYS